MARVRRRAPGPRAARVVTALALAAAVAAPVGTGAAPAAGAAARLPAPADAGAGVAGDPDGGCEQRDASGTCIIEDEEPGGGSGDGSGGGGGDGGGSGSGGGGGSGFDPVAICQEEAPYWGDCVAVVRGSGQRPSQICGQVYHPDQSLLDYYQPDAPDNAVLTYYVCPADGGPVYTEDTDWYVPSGVIAPPPPPSPAEVAARAHAELEVPAPELAASPPCRPPAGSGAWQCEPEIVGVPTFVEVTNWQGERTVEASEGPVAVALTLTPSLELRPGEPGAAAVECEPGGTAYVPGGPPPREQAGRPGACAHAYEQRSASGGSAGAWRGSVAVTWTVTWEQTDSAGSESGSFDPFTLETELLRPVEEVQSIVTDGELGS